MCLGCRSETRFTLNSRGAQGGVKKASAGGRRSWTQGGASGKKGQRDIRNERSGIAVLLSVTSGIALCAEAPLARLSLPSRASCESRPIQTRPRAACVRLLSRRVDGVADDDDAEKEVASAPIIL